MQTLIEGTSQKGLDFLPKTLGVRGGGVRFERLAAPPDGHDGEVIQAVHLLHQFETHAARIFSAVSGKFLEDPDGLPQIASAYDVDMRDDVNASAGFRRRRLGAGVLDRDAAPPQEPEQRK